MEKSAKPKLRGDVPQLRCVIGRPPASTAFHNSIVAKDRVREVESPRVADAIPGHVGLAAWLVSSLPLSSSFLAGGSRAAGRRC